MAPEKTSPWERKTGDLRPFHPLRGSKYPMIDSHLHVVNFIQETPGGEVLLSTMDRANVGKAVIFGLPVTKVWTEYDKEPPEFYLANDAPCYYYSYTDVIVAELVQSLTPAQQDRLYPLICGFNPTDRFAVRHVERLLRQYPGLWSGIGELLLRHDDLTALTYGENARATHRALWPVFEFAGEHGLPVLVHNNVTSVTRGDCPIYLAEITQALQDFPRTQFVFAHCGMSCRVNAPFYPRMVEHLLQERPNLYVDYSWLIYDVAICPGDQPHREWVELTERYSERICLGSNLIGGFERLGPEMQRYDVFLDALSDEARANVCWHTPERIYGGNKNKVRFDGAKPDTPDATLAALTFRRTNLPADSSPDAMGPVE